LAIVAVAVLVAPALVAPVVAQTKAPALAQTKDLRVVTRVLPPMVSERDGALTGFSIELWNEIAARLRLKTSYHIAPDIAALLSDVRSGKAELGVAAISITSARETEFEFSHPILNAGLQIMVRGAGKDSESSPLRDILSLLFSWTSLAWLGIAALLVLIPAHAVWYFERAHENGIIPTPKYYPGILYALYWAAGTLATQAEQAPKHWIARVFAVLWMFTGVVFVALYTAQLAATLTVQQIGGGINGPEDLAGKRVASTRGSTAAAVVRELRGQLVEVAQIQDAFQALDNKTVDAVVFDSPVLLYYAANDGKGRVTTVGGPFRKEDYGIVFPRGSPLRSQVNVVLLKMREDGTYGRIYDKWFASK
jgi:polar amino acid transport system substrate-binding protein